jgi:hypothetical protein
MKKLILFIGLMLVATRVWGAPSNTMSISPTATDGSVIEASDENSRNNEVSTKYNAHTHTDISSTDQSFTFQGTIPTATIGDGGEEDTRLLYDGNAQDYYIGIDDSDDNLKIGLGSTIGTTQYIDINETGEIVTASQPGFLAFPTSSQDNVATGTVQVSFGTQVFDQNSDYDSGTSTFTAPVTGRYQFNVYLVCQTIDSASTRYDIQIETSNRTYAPAWDPRQFAADIDQWTFVCNTLADMDAGDTAIVNIVQASGTAQTDILTGSFFSGFLAL